MSLLPPPGPGGRAPDRLLGVPRLVPPPPRIRRQVPDSEIAGETASALLYMIATGSATNRADLARTLGLPPSTITGKIAQLLRAGLVEERGSGDPTGGRRPRVLHLRDDAGVMLAADLGRSHARLALLSMSGTIVDARTIPIDIGAGPHGVLALVAAALRVLVAGSGHPVVRGVGMCLPGPVDTARGMVESPASMPGWHRFDVVGWLADEFDAVAVVDNDANMMGLGEHATLDRRAAASRVRVGSMLFLKAGASVGCGIVINGHVYRGATALAGDIAHVRVAAAAGNPCNCGNSGCLETVVGAAGIVAGLRAAGAPVRDLPDAVRLAHDGDPRATTQLRQAGRTVGDTLAAVVNFFNPEVVVIGGMLSTVEPFVAAIRSQLYESCHPLATTALRIQQTEAGLDAGVLGIGQLCLRRALAQLY
ncbi:ROK family transcriptional regulator [Clavibacter michiganensis]|nr:ROK family transcriptional regulator [Clavibacter michiganensis]PPF55736.1 ROK family transcriptional regulator [Clavibacter michiganensis]